MAATGKRKILTLDDRVDVLKWIDNGPHPHILQRGTRPGEEPGVFRPAAERHIHAGRSL